MGAGRRCGASARTGDGHDYRIAARVRRGDDVRLIIGGDPKVSRDQRLINLMAEARLAHEHLITSAALSLDDLAIKCGHLRKHFSRLLRLATLAPDLVGAILDGRQPAYLSHSGLLAAPDVPVAWDEQRTVFGFA